MVRILLCSLIAIFFICDNSLAQKNTDISPSGPVFYLDEAEQAEISAYAGFLPVSSFEESFPSVQNFQEAPHFKKYSSLKPNELLGNKYWLRLNLQNPDDRARSFVLNLSPLQEIKVFQIQRDQDEGFPSLKALSQRGLPLFLDFSPQESRSLYIYFENSHFPNRIPDINYYTLPVWHQHIKMRRVGQSAFQGVLWLSIVFSICLSFFYRHRPFAFYALYLLAVALFFGYTFFLSADAFSNKSGIVQVFGLLAGFVPPLYLLFIRRFLSIKYRYPDWDRFYRILIQGGILLTGLLILLSFSFPAIIEFVFPHLVLVEYLGISVLVLHLFRTSSRVSRYFSINALILCSLSITGFFSSYYFDKAWGFYVVEAAVLIEMLVLMLGSLRGVFTRENHRRRIHNNLISRLQKSERLQNKLNKELEAKVRERTAEIMDQKNKLEQLNMVKDKLFSIISHDLRSPLTSLQGSLQVLHMGLLTKTEEQIIFKSLHYKLNHTKSLLDNLLYWAMIQMEKVSTKFEPINLKEILQEVLLNFKEANKKNIEIISHIPKNAIAFADHNMVHIIFKNIINNALKFTPENGRVIINVQSKNDHLEVSIEDNGIGMTQEETNRLFKPDTHFSMPGTEMEKGTGIGLLLCKEFVERNQGYIGVSSQKGQGSCFYFALRKKANFVMKNDELYDLNSIIFV